MKTISLADYFSTLPETTTAMRKRSIVFALALFCGLGVSAANVSISISGFSYTPATVTVNVGDVVTIEASGFHPLIQVSQQSFNANDPTLLSGGFSSITNFNLTITAGMAGSSIYYMCSSHGASGMKGQINVNVVSGIEENNRRDFNFTVYPNPVTTGAWLNISLQKTEHVTLTLYDMQGRIVRRLLDKQMNVGESTTNLPLYGLTRGNYIVQMRSGKEKIEKQIVLQ